MQKEILKKIGFIALIPIVLVLNDVLSYVLIEGMNKFFPNQSQGMIINISTLVIIIVFALAYKAFFDKDYTVKDKKISIINKAVLVGLGMLGFSTLWFLLTDLFLYKISFINNSLESFGEVSESYSENGLVSMFFDVALLGPIQEELLFRGLVYNLLKKVRGGAFPIIVSSILFGIWHGVLVQAVYTAIGGILLATLYERSKSIKAPMLSHIVNNTISCLPDLLGESVIVRGFDIVGLVAILPTAVVLASYGRKKEELA